MHTFKLSDESVNSYGFVTKTEGIDTSFFFENPVMLYEHDSLNVIGKWQNVRKENGALLADAQFDEEDELAQKVKGKVERGYLKGVSIGMHIEGGSVINDADGTPTANKTRLFEASICAVPANSRSLRLYNNNKKELTEKEKSIFLSSIQTKKTEMNKTTTEAMLSALAVSDADAATTRIQDLLKKEKKLEKLQEETQKRRDTEIENLLTSAIQEGKIKAGEKETYKALADKEFELFKNILNKLAVVPRLSEIPKPTGGAENLLSFREWRKKDPIGLLQFKAENPEEYSEILKKEGLQTKY